jgi:hypothetical protein
MKYDFKVLKMAFQNIIFKEYLNLVHKNGQSYEITPFLMVFVSVYIHFRIWIRIRNPRVTDTDPAKVPDPCGSGSGSTTLLFRAYFDQKKFPKETFQKIYLGQDPDVFKSRIR